MKNSLKNVNKYRNVLVDNENKYLITSNYEISNLYMNPKLHKSKELNEIIKYWNFEYIHITENLPIEGQPIVAESVYYTSGISEILNSWTVAFFYTSYFKRLF